MSNGPQELDGYQKLLVLSDINKAAELLFRYDLIPNFPDTIVRKFIRANPDIQEAIDK